MAMRLERGKQQHSIYRALGALLVVAASPLAAADVPPRILGFERFYSNSRADTVASGQLLLGELNCTSCHKADPSLDRQIDRKAAPVLDTVCSRVQPEYLLKF